MSLPKLIEGGIHIDARGQIKYIENFPQNEIKRFYILSNNRPDFVRAWHGHKKEGKYLFALTGDFLVGCVEIDNWANPSKSLDVKKYFLSSTKPQLLHIPSGYANGIMNLSSENKIIIFSTSSLEDSLGDDFRFEYDYWNIWDIEKR